MLKQILSLLSKSAIDREALTRSYLNIKPRLFLLGLRRLKIFFIKPIILGLVSVLILLVFTPNIILAQDINVQFALPHAGYISTYYSSYHPGIDLASDLGTPVYPVTKGVVEEVIYEKFGLGTHVLLSHSDGYKSLYAHMGRVLVAVGQSVDLGTELGEVGLTGHTSGPHTHLEVTKNGQYVDPSILLPKLLPLADNSSFSYAVGGNLPKQEESKLTKSLKVDFK